MTWAAIAAAGCCCSTTDCDCPEYETVTVTWSGDFTFEWCCDCGCGLGDHSESFGPLAIQCTRVEGSGNCSYIGDETYTITLPVCGEAGSVDVHVHVHAAVSYNALASKWEASIFVQRDWLTIGDYCGWYTGGFGNAMIGITKRAAAANGTYPLCPYLGTYTTNVSTCEPSGAECTTGVDCCATLSAYSSGSLSVSYP